MFSFEANIFKKLLKKEDAAGVDEKPKSSPYQEGTIEHSLMPKGGRGLDIYEQQLMFNRSELNNKTVLDLGAGPELKLMRDLADAWITADVISLSPDFSEEKFAKQARSIAPDAKLIAGTGQNLPFQNESFDNILAFHVAEHLSSKQFLDVVSEMARTLKPGGKAIIGPTTNQGYVGENVWKPYEAILENAQLKKQFDDFDFEIEKQMIPEEIIKPIRLKTNDGLMKYFEPAFNIVLRRKEGVE